MNRNTPKSLVKLNELHKANIEKRLAHRLEAARVKGDKDELAAQVAATFKSAEETDDKSATIIVVVLLVVATIVPMATYFWYQGFSG